MEDFPTACRCSIVAELRQCHASKACEWEKHVDGTFSLVCGRELGENEIAARPRTCRTDEGGGGGEDT